MNSIKEDWTNKMEFTLNENRIFSICIVGFSKLHIIKQQVTGSIVLAKIFKLFCCLLSTFRLALEFTLAKKNMLISPHTDICRIQTQA